MSYSLISTDFFELFAIIAKGYILTHKINLGNNSKKLLDRNLTFSIDSDSDHIINLVDFILKFNIILFFIECPLSFIKLLIERGH